MNALNSSAKAQLTDVSVAAPLKSACIVVSAACGSDPVVADEAHFDYGLRVRQAVEGERCERVGWQELVY